MTNPNQNPPGYNGHALPPTPYALLREATAIMKRLSDAMIIGEPIKFRIHDFVIMNLAARYLQDSMDAFDAATALESPKAKEAVADFLKKLDIPGDNTNTN